MKNLDQVNNNLRRGAITTLLVLGVMTALYVVLMAPVLLRPGSPTHSTLGMIVSVLVVAALIGHTWGALRTMRTRITADGLAVAGPGEPTSIHWDDVVRLRFDSQRVVLERRGSPATVVSLLYVNRPDELREAICSLVPTRALQGPDA